MGELVTGEWKIKDATLVSVHNRKTTTVLTGLPTSVSLLADENGVGAFLQCTAEKASSTLSLPLGDLSGISRFTSCHRYEPFWMTPKVGTKGGEVAKETQYLLCERTDGTVILLIPLVSGAFRCSLEGTRSDGLVLVAESGDDAIITNNVVGLFVASGSDPFSLLEASATSVANYLKTGRLRRDKTLPDFVDYFGWCTWDAFYQEVSHDKVRQGLESFRQGGVEPRVLILDDGWQSVQIFPTGEKRLTSFAANEKFPEDLAPTVAMAKQEFDIETFLVWHAVSGYWGGVDGTSLPGYGVRPIVRKYSAAIDEYAPSLKQWFGYACGTVDTAHIYRFYQDYHRHLRKQGVDGVKVDNQASLESLTHGGGFGGRVGIMQAYHEALEGSAQTQFQGNLINCMSCANEMFYSLLNSTITRTSTDFWPNRPESHGLHLFCNAQVSAWFGEFAHPDWDMFQSGHEMGAYHAAGRAVSGSPVYVSDKPGIHNFDLLKKLVLMDGTVPRPEYPGRPTRDCLFHDPTKEDVLLKIWNINESSFDETGILGVFHARYGDGVGAITGQILPTDIEGLEGDFFAVYSHYGQELRVLDKGEAWSLTLEPLTSEVFTIVPVTEGFGETENSLAVIGLAEIFNSRKTINSVNSFLGHTMIGVWQPGTLVVYSQRTPTQIVLMPDELPLSFQHDPITGKLTIDVPSLEMGEEEEGAPLLVDLEFPI